MTLPCFRFAFVLGTLILASAPRLARADELPPEKPRFGQFGQLALHLNEGVTESQGDLIAGSQIQVDYFVADHVSLGLMIGANWYSTSVVDDSSTHQFVFRIGPRVGVDLPLSDVVSFWPQVGVDYRSNHENETYSFAPTGVTAVSTSTTSSAFGITVVAPLMIHPTPGFFVGAGPSFYTEISNSVSTNSGSSGDNSKVTSLGVMATIGGAI